MNETFKYIFFHIFLPKNLSLILWATGSATGEPLGLNIWCCSPVFEIFFRNIWLHVRLFRSNEKMKALQIQSLEEVIATNIVVHLQPDLQQQGLSKSWALVHNQRHNLIYWIQGLNLRLRRWKIGTPGSLRSRRTNNNVLINPYANEKIHATPLKVHRFIIQIIKIICWHLVESVGHRSLSPKKIRL